MTSNADIYRRLGKLEHAISEVKKELAVRQWKHMMTLAALIVSDVITHVAYK